MAFKHSENLPKASFGSGFPKGSQFIFCPIKINEQNIEDRSFRSPTLENWSTTLPKIDPQHFSDSVSASMKWKQIKFHVLNQIITYWCQVGWLKYFTARLPRRVCCQPILQNWRNLCFFLESAEKRNAAASQFHVLWIFIIHLCSTISHLSIHVCLNSVAICSHDFTSRPSTPLTTSERKMGPISVRNRINCNMFGKCFNSNELFACSFRSNKIFKLNESIDIGRHWLKLKFHFDINRSFQIEFRRHESDRNKNQGNDRLNRCGAGVRLRVTTGKRRTANAYFRTAEWLFTQSFNWCRKRFASRRWKSQQRGI